MPLYEYQCESCEHRFERIQKFSDPLVEVCPACGKSTVKKLLSSPAIQFKGSGWYITDYARKSTTDKGTSDKGSSDKGKSSDSGSTQSSDTSTSKSDSSSAATKSTDTSKKD